jgi:hypothetical protein
VAPARVPLRKGVEARRSGVGAVAKKGVEARGSGVGAVELQVIVSKDGLIADGCDDSTSVTEHDRTAAYAAVLDHIAAHSEQAVAVGIDVALLAALYC